MQGGIAESDEAGPIEDVPCKSGEPTAPVSILSKSSRVFLEIPEETYPKETYGSALVPKESYGVG
jgi:hypothetical protein